MIHSAPARRPSRAPYYLDVVLGSDSVAWAFRRDRDTPVADLYHFRTGYLGSFVLVQHQLPAIARDNLAWFILTDSLGIDTFQAVDLPASFTNLTRRQQ